MDEGVRSPGRPRSEAARAAILDAAIAELQDVGFAALTIQGIAARAGVGKQTIYRWWGSKADIVLEAIGELATARIRVPDKGSLRADLTAFLTATFRQREQAPVLAGLMSHALLDPQFAEQFRERFLASRRAALRGLLERAAERDELHTGVDLELVIDVVYGVLWYRVLLTGARFDQRTGRELADLVVRAVGGY